MTSDERRATSDERRVTSDGGVVNVIVVIVVPDPVASATTKTNVPEDYDDIGASCCSSCCSVRAPSSGNLPHPVGATSEGEARPMASDSRRPTCQTKRSKNTHVAGVDYDGLDYISMS